MWASSVEIHAGRDRKLEEARKQRQIVGSRLREKARALVSGQFRVTDVLLPRREQSLKFRFRVLEFRYDQGVPGARR